MEEASSGVGGEEVFEGFAYGIGRLAIEGSRGEGVDVLNAVTAVDDEDIVLGSLCERTVALFTFAEGAGVGNCSREESHTDGESEGGGQEEEVGHEAGGRCRGMLRRDEDPQDGVGGQEEGEEEEEGKDGHGRSAAEPQGEDCGGQEECGGSKRRKNMRHD